MAQAFPENLRKPYNYNKLHQLSSEGGAQVRPIFELHQKAINLHYKSICRDYWRGAVAHLAQYSLRNTFFDFYDLYLDFI